MTEPLSDDILLSLKYFLKDDAYAIKYVIDLLFIAHLWDDLFDKDVHRTDEDINQGFIRSLGEIPTNPFYQAYQAQLAPMMANALTMWLESNELEKGNKNEKLTAFSICASVVEIIHYCILLKGGIAWVREVGVDFWKLFGLTEKDYDEVMR